MIPRILQQKIKEMAGKMPIISITGPRQSGKTTLARACFPEYTYQNLESPDVFERAQSDPRSFLTNHKYGLIIDESQRLPELFSYIQTISDERNNAGEFILTGSQNFLLSEKIAQSLAGRVFITHLLPFCIRELKNTRYHSHNVNEYIFNGFYPRLYYKEISAELFYPSYIQTYTERDVRQFINVSNLHIFQKFMRLAAGRTGQLINYNSIANETGMDIKTIQSWFTILESSFIVFFLQPHYNNFNKRLVKSPKLYFYDTGLACSLLGIREVSELDTHWARGALFKNLIIADMMKGYYHDARVPSVYFWRDNTGNEIDCLLDEGGKLSPCEIKSSKTINREFFQGLEYYKKLAGDRAGQSYLIYSGNDSYIRSGHQVLAWDNIEQVL